jgi:hypothetical protein
MLKKIKYSFILVILFLTTSSSSIFQNNTNIIVWNENRPLKWADFRGKPEKRFAAASTHYDILKNWKVSNNLLTVSIQAVFLTQNSWKKKRWINEEVLIHEQKHFDIVEIYARKIRKALSETNIKSTVEAKQIIETICKQYEEEMDVYQDLYDQESNWSMNGEGQRIWNRNILEELQSLNEFKGSTLLLTIPL